MSDFAVIIGPLVSGDIVHFKVLGQRMIVLNSVNVARELFEKRSAIYSDRPTSVMFNLYGAQMLRRRRKLTLSRAGWGTRIGV